MKVRQNFAAVLFIIAVHFVVPAQSRGTGGIKGKVKVETGTAAGVSVVVRRGEQEVTRVATDKGGSFVVSGLQPGRYGLTFRKPGLSVGTIENVEVKSGKTRSLGDRLVLSVDEGSIAFIRGSVFSPSGRSVPGAALNSREFLRMGPQRRLTAALRRKRVHSYSD